MSAEGTTVWERTAEVLIEQVSDTVWSSTFQDIQVDALHDDVLTLAVPSQLVRQRIEQRYFSLLEAALTDAGYPEIRLILEVEIDDRRPEPGDALTVDLTTAARPEPAPAAPEDEGSRSSGPRRYTFDSFVIGPSNRFAHAAALSVAETPARSYNPLFVYGGAGLGKTHLLQAIAQYVRDNYPTYQVRYISTETLLNEFVDAIRKNEQPDFKRRYREIDVLLVDDIQFMEGKEQLQEEFFHTFNTLYEAQRQIVLSSDRPPDNIATLEDRLRSRFKMGLITDIQPPDFETRLAILRKKNEQSATSVPPEVLSYIAEHITYNIRELEGALIRVSAYAALNQTELTVDLASDILADTISSTKPRQITPALILAQTAERFGLDVEQLQSRSRTRNLVHARQIAMYVCRELTDLSYPQIGREFGGRDHTTVIHAYDKVAALMQEKHETYEDVTALIQSLLSER
ncbi:chromosomal replication initiator protein DnaA [Dermatobacter hominis]|uniref:chromosomal replication initiator protein DnaA n=1 Tax=Dermatobacter hominis TaxID=2884263 RepID=UPI001D10C928|nr:chromosomal replication initiator protein DnaA [Dermatobacter hominis]UDY34344.1 chromosomal replication initiator protein DnaA [Dermatobacter hominis]